MQQREKDLREKCWRYNENGWWFFFVRKFTFNIYTAFTLQVNIKQIAKSYKKKWKDLPLKVFACNNLICKRKILAEVIIKIHKNTKMEVESTS